MALYRYTYAYADGRQATNVIAAGNSIAARTRAERHARGRDATLVGEVTVVRPESGADQGTTQSPKGACPSKPRVSERDEAGPDARRASAGMSGGPVKRDRRFPDEADGPASSRAARVDYSGRLKVAREK